MGSDLPFTRGGARRGAEFVRGLSEPEPDPLADVEYTGDLEADAAAELAALDSAFVQRRKREDDRFRDATDSEFWVAVCFRSRADKEAFLAAVAKGHPLSGDKYVSGYELAERLGIDI